MANRRKIFFRYRAFSTKTLSSLYEDKLYFSHPGEFNDPLECSPTLTCDSSNEDLRRLLAFFINSRVSSEVMSHLRRARLEGNNAAEYAKSQALHEAERQLASIEHLAMDPEYNGSIEENESWLLTEDIERELHRWYERGVCCFSKSYKSPVLWSHYADEHKGLCIGYTTERDPEPQLHQVDYSGKRLIATSEICEAFLHENQTAVETVHKKVLLRKARSWKYESEWRLIGQQGLHSSPLLLTEVIFGMRCSPCVKLSVITTLEGRDNKVKFYEMYDDRNSFNLRRRLVDKKDYFPETAGSGIKVLPPPDFQY